MNKDNLIANVRSLKDYFNTDYSYTGKNLSDCKTLTVGSVVIIFSDTVQVKHEGHIAHFSYDEFDQVYDLLLFNLYKSTVTVQGTSITFKCSVGAFHTFDVKEKGSDLVIDVSRNFPRMYDAYKFFKQFLPAFAMHNGYLSDAVNIPSVPFTFKLFYKGES